MWPSEWHSGTFWKTKDTPAIPLWTGEDGLGKIKAQDFALVLLDIKLPDINGIGVLWKIKEMKPEQMVVMITGYPSTKTAKESVRTGVYGYLTKPLGPEKLLPVVEDALMMARFV